MLSRKQQKEIAYANAIRREWQKAEGQLFEEETEGGRRRAERRRANEALLAALRERFARDAN